MNLEYSRDERDRERLRSVLRRLNSAEFVPFLEFLKESVKDRYDTLLNATDTTVVFRMQGQIKALSDILETVASATSKGDR